MDFAETFLTVLPDNVMIEFNQGSRVFRVNALLAGSNSGVGLACNRLTNRKGMCEKYEIYKDAWNRQ